VNFPLRGKNKAKNKIKIPIKDTSIIPSHPKNETKISFPMVSSTTVLNVAIILFSQY